MIMGNKIQFPITDAESVMWVSETRFVVTVPGPCSVCSNMTITKDVYFKEYLCSPECENDRWKTHYIENAKFRFRGDIDC